VSGDKPGREYGWVGFLALFVAIAVVIGALIGLVAAAAAAWLFGLI
jgi:hypothetical protein